MDYLRKKGHDICNYANLASAAFERAPEPPLTETNLPDQSGKVYVVTGSTAGVGLALTKILYAHNAKVYMTARSETKAKIAVEEIKKHTPDSKGALDILLLDFADLSTVKPGVAKFLANETRLHGIVHNAGVMYPPQGSHTKQGYELQFGVNNLGPQLLQHFLDDIIIETAKHEPAGKTRIVWVSSTGHLISPPTGFNKEWLGTDTRKINDGSRMGLYGQSKAINIYQGYMWMKHHKNSNVISAAVHPGFLRTELNRHSAFNDKVIGRFGSEPRFGAYSELYVLASPEITAENIVPYYTYWGRPGKHREDIAKGLEEVGEELWNLLEERVKEYL